MRKNLLFIALSLLCMAASVMILSARRDAGPPLAPEYGRAENWAYLGAGTDKPADVFLLCPTVHLGEGGLRNMPLDDGEARRRFVGALNMERGIYEDVCLLYAPFYRQATLGVYDLPEAEAEEAFALAYADVRAAFLHYLENLNRGRPIVLAGFSQGSDMCIRLLRELAGDPALSERLVAAYAVGWRVTDEDLANWPLLRMARGEDDTGVIVSFNTESPETAWSVLVPKRTHGINPLNWRTDSRPAGRDLNLGACFTDYSGNIVREVPHFTGAYLDARRGTLKTLDVSADDYPPVLPIFADGIFHLYDYQFFYRNLQANVARRVEAYLHPRPADSVKIPGVAFRPAARRFKENYPAIFGREPPAATPTANRFD